MLQRSGGAVSDASSPAGAAVEDSSSGVPSSRTAAISVDVPKSETIAISPIVGRMSRLSRNGWLDALAHGRDGDCRLLQPLRPQEVDYAQHQQRQQRRVAQAGDYDHRD